ncbi:hypothetical protein EUX98_g6964 [Antrodiella citrinella]|uniref:CSC1/OSCA1-like 7TM region domain-containing protein n=1 Tax=Antrodiella citrinella TaxID=2447956 RepID=A0A4S4MV60_9APHY|nr:hypothetical protein EUX98_g6964 [Antrodiella citrinella]
MSEVSSASAQSSSSQTFLTALVTNLIILAVELVAFVVLKHKLTRIYEPRTYLPPPDKRAVALPSGPWKWLFAILAIPTSDVLHKNGLDAYMFLRFLRMLVMLFAGISFLTWLVILPIDAVGVRNPQFSDGLARLSWGNIPDDANKRYAAHIIVVYITTFFTVWLVRKELFHYTEMRQAFLVSKSHSRLAQARTVLITAIPFDMCNEEELKLWASFVPGGIQNIWVYRDTTLLNKHHNARLDACKKLEAASAQLISRVVKSKRKQDKQANKTSHKLKQKHPSGQAQRTGDVEKGFQWQNDDTTRRKTDHKASLDTINRPLRPQSGGDDIETATTRSEAYEMGDINTSENGYGPSLQGGHSPMPGTSVEQLNVPERDGYGSGDGSANGDGSRDGSGSGDGGERGEREESVPSAFDPTQVDAMIQQFVPEKKRPMHRLGFLGLWGRKVDTIEWCKDEISRLNKEIDVLRAELGERKPMGSAFIQCNLQLGAHVLAQCVSFHEPLMMSEKFIEVTPKDVIWDNIDDGAYETRFRYVTSWMGSLVLIALWFLPVAFVGTLSNVSALCRKVSWLCWIKNAPTPIPGIIQGLLPPLFLSILFAVLPILLRGLAWYENIPRWSLLSISVYKRYYLFLVVHGFLVVTLSSSITATASNLISNPTEAVSELASQLPSASIFFLTWTISQGLAGAGSALLQVGVLVMYLVKKWWLGRTPREAFRVTFMMPKADFGLILPKISLLATIALAYSVLAPIINGLAMVAFMLFFFSWKFLLTWVFDQPEEAETGGKYFPLAINFLFTGLYIEQFCLAVLFFLKISQGIAFIAQGALMLVLMALTASVQILFQSSFNPITGHLPMSLATKQMKARWEQERQKKRAPGQNQGEGKDEETDMFSRSRISSVVRKRIKHPVMRLKKGMDKGVSRTIKSAAGQDFKNYGTGSEASPRPSYASSRRNLPTIAPATIVPKERVRKGDGDADSDDDEDLDFDENGFTHPSMYTNQPWIWLPKDEVGVSERLVREYVAAGVDASDLGAYMDMKGDVEVQRNPPDEEWAGGHDA